MTYRINGECIACSACIPECHGQRIAGREPVCTDDAGRCTYRAAGAG